MKNITRFATILSGKTGRIIVMALTIALFVISAGAPNATVGIGK
jgi:low affinity Fe/Cu permease